MTSRFATSVYRTHAESACSQLRSPCSSIIGALFGYILGFIAAAAVVGALAERGQDRNLVPESHLRNDP